MCENLWTKNFILALFVTKKKRKLKQLCYTQAMKICTSVHYNKVCIGGHGWKFYEKSCNKAWIVGSDFCFLMLMYEGTSNSSWEMEVEVYLGTKMLKMWHIFSLTCIPMCTEKKPQIHTAWLSVIAGEVEWEGLVSVVLCILKSLTFSPSAWATI